MDDVPAAAARFGLHPGSGQLDVVPVKPADRRVKQRSREEGGLRRVSPRRMAADLGDGTAFAATLRWLARHEAQWCRPMPERISPGTTGARRKAPAPALAQLARTEASTRLISDKS
ncbi:MAG: hypothetical protein JXP73_09395 [Deltaproteobacteria bacterium]|nr:hypothetical protein [Deltaproteobacteria bacterium]